MTGDPVAGVDVGGTFTDAVVLLGGRPHIAKVPTTPRDQSEGVAAAVAAASPQPSTAPLAALAHGTTTATNAVLERRLDRAALLLTEGFADLLTIGRQNRPSLYDLSRTRPVHVIGRDMVIPVRERVTAGGEVDVPLSEEEVARVVTATAALQPDSVAICLLFSWADPSHERRLAAALRRQLGDVHLTVSSDLVGAIREYERASTCALNAAVGRLMPRYLDRLDDATSAAAVTVMTSGGGTATLAEMVRRPVDTLLSGPAAGVVAAAAAARAAGFDDAVAFDMGGTSTDVCLIRDGRAVMSVEGTIDNLPIGTPTIGVHTVGAGGGSIAALDAGGALTVGPRSAGAVPGPACYGRGGTEATVTDAHAALGHLVDLADGTVTPDLDASAAALRRLPGVTPQGILDVVRAAMAKALRRVTTEAGTDPAGLALVAYGGAGPMHAVDLARELGCAAAVIPPAPGVLSALGLLRAPQRSEHSRSVLVNPDATAVALDAFLAELPDAGEGDERSVAADVRYRGQAHELRIPLPHRGNDADDTSLATRLTAAFHDAHRRTYGYDMAGAEVQVVTLRVVTTRPPLSSGPVGGWALGSDTADSSATADLGEGMQQVPLVRRGRLRPGEEVTGPAIITQPDTTTLIPEGVTAHVHDDLSLVVPT